jgi:RHS repeat-associated protein
MNTSTNQNGCDSERHLRLVRLLAAAMGVVGAFQQVEGAADKVPVIMQGTQIGFARVYGEPRDTGSLSFSVGSATLSASSSVPEGGSVEVGDLGPTEVQLEYGKPYSVVIESALVLRGDLRLQLPPCYELINEYGGGVEPHWSGTGDGTFSCTVIVTNFYGGTVVIEPASCGCSEEPDDPPSMLADGLSQTLARVPGWPIESWTFEGDSLGCGLLPQGEDAAIITAGEEAGVVTVKATDVYGCEFYGVLELCEVGDGGGCEGGGCEIPGSGQPRVGPDGPGMAWSMGRDGPRSHGGNIRLRPLPGVPLQSPQTLKPHPRGSRTEWIWGGNETLRQVKGPAAFVTVSVTATNASGVVVGYELRFYPPDAAGFWMHDGYELLGGYSPNPVWRILNPDSSGSTTNRLRIVEVRDLVSRTNDFEYASGTWKQTDPVTPREIHAWRAAAGGGVTNEVREVKSGAVVQERRLRRFEVQGDRRVLTRIEDGVSPALRTTEFTYYPANAPVGWRGQRQQVSHPDGGWAIYEYDDSGRVSREYAAWGDQAPTTNTALCRVADYRYSLTQGADGVEDPGTWLPMEPRKTIVQIKGNEVSRTYQTLSAAERIRKASPVPNPSGGWNHATNLTTITRYFVGGDWDGRVKEIVHPDGTWSTFSYTATVGGGELMTNRTGQASAGVVINGLQTVTEMSEVGRTLSSTVRPVVGGTVQSQKIAEEIYTYGDGLNPSYQVVSLGGRTNEVFQGCCGLEAETDWEGVTTYYEYDTLLRRVATERLGIQWTNVLDAAGRVLVRQRIGTDASMVLQDRYTYDVLGRVTAHTNALDGVTLYSEGLTNSKLHRLTVNPDQGQRLEIYYRDGRLERVTNNAAFPVRYVYGVEQEGGAWRETMLEIRYRGDSNTNEWTKTYTDGLGRAYKTVYASTSGAPQRLLIYNHLGQLIREEDPDGVRTLYQYDALGRREYAAVDLNQNGQIDPGGTDRITRVVEDYATFGAKDVRQTTRSVHTTDNNPATATVGLTRVSTDGLKGWSSVYRDGSTAVTTTNEIVFHRPSGGRTNTVFEPDGSRTESAFSNGRLQSVTRKDAGGNQVTRTSYSYDYHGRVYAVTDARNGTSYTAYNAADQPVSVTGPDPGQGAQTTVTFYDSSGRTIGQWLPDGMTTTNHFLKTGLLQKSWGARQYPVEYAYDAQGRMTNMVTWQAFDLVSGSGASPASTTWLYDSYRGWLAVKGYADPSTGAATTNGPVYSYTAAGRLASRVWQRGVTTTYGYNSGGDLRAVVYSDGTMGLTNSYDRLGRLASVVRGSRTVSWTYNLADRPLTETIAGGTLAGWSIVNEYNARLQRTHQRLREGGTTRQEARYGYDGAGRLQAMTNGLVAGLRAAYSYLPNSDLVGTLALTNNGTTRGLVTSRDYDRLNRLRTISSKAYGTAAPSLPVAFDYPYNAANQRTRVNREDGAYWVYTYDDLGQVISGRKYWGDGTEVAGQQFDYAFDTIGNRTGSGGRASAVSAYTRNRINQYTQRTVPSVVDVQGVANPTANVTVRVVGATTYTAARKGEYYHHALTVGNNVYPEVEVKSLYGATQTQTGRVFNRPATETFTHDADGNLTQDGRWTYSWDGENRLIEMKRDTDTPAGARQRLVFEYDHQGRRIRKQFYTHNGSSWVLSSDTAFAYDGWNLVGELNAAASNARLRTFLWGLDLSGSEQGAGGVGGLWLVIDYTNDTTYHWPAYDGNGNVAALVAQANGSLSARYEYGPFGEPIRATGPMARKNPFRFSTKFTDNETGLIYYGYRFYDPVTGRWLNGDPIGERGGVNLRGFARNAPVDFVDIDGRFTGTKCKVCNQWYQGYHVCPLRPVSPPVFDGPVEMLWYLYTGDLSMTGCLSERLKNGVQDQMFRELQQQAKRELRAASRCCRSGGLEFGVRRETSFGFEGSWDKQCGAFQVTGRARCHWRCGGPGSGCACLASCVAALDIHKKYTFNPDYNPKNEDWWWAHLLAIGLNTWLRGQDSLYVIMDTVEVPFFVEYTVD